MVREAFGDQPAFAPDNLTRLATRVQRGFIRVDADEVTYPAHVILRYEIERALIEGEAEVDDIPVMWDARMHALLGLDTRGNFKGRPDAGCALALGGVWLLPLLHAWAPCWRRSGLPRCASKAPLWTTKSRGASWGLCLHGSTRTSGVRAAAGPRPSW